MTAPSTTPSGPVRAVKFSRLPKHALLLGLTAAQLAAITAGALPLIVALYIGGTAIIFAVPFTVVGVGVAVVPVGGRAVVDWLPVTVAWAWRSLTGQLTFRARVDRPRPAGTLALPGRAAALRRFVDPVTGAALVHDPHASTLSMSIPVTSAGFELLDPGDQSRRVTGWGRVLATVCRSGRIKAVQVTQRTLPGSGASLVEWWNERQAGDSEFASRIYAELIERAGPTAERHQSVISLALDMQAAGRAIRAAGGGMTGAAAVLRQEAETLTTALRSADLTPAAPLDPAGLALWLRTGYDPPGAPVLEQHAATGRDLATAGPVAVAESWGALRSDSSWHAVLWISQWPQTAVDPGFLAPLLLTSGLQRALTIRYEPLRADVAARDLRRKKTGHITEAAQRARLGQIEDVTQVNEYDDVLTQEAELAAGHGVLRTTGLITVSAPDLDALEHDVAAIEQAAIQAGCETRRLWGQQSLALARTLTA
ncbi:SCO6880 family protein [Promicromonospora sp. NPDC023987]|uniref:SCO6880 family protein n=1 Tax=Promicromonospora sp. NPDC023987 TaxID=3155360 RepID=UPI00340EC51C